MSASTPAALKHWRRRRAELFRTILRPPPRLTLSEWADSYRQLSRENSAEPGRWRTDRVPHLREIMDAITDPSIEEVAVMKSAQIGATEGILGNAIGYYIDQDPSSILLIQPTVDDAEKWSKEKLAPMLRDTPCLASKVADSRSRDSGNTILNKTFPGGFLGVVGANSPRGLRSRSIRVLLADEVDGYPASAGTEGDPLTLAKKRTLTFWNRKLVEISTPTLKGFSRIERLYQESDQRRYFVPCPHCGYEQVLVWKQIKWERAEEEGGTVHDPDSAAYLCESCACLIEEKDKARMVSAGRWVAGNPRSRIRGYHVNALYSLFPGASWATLVREWLAAQEDVERLKAFVNTVLGETWEERGEAVTPEGLAARAEKYGAEVPAGVGVLTAGVDVQADRLELLVRGWGAEEESWLIGHHRIYGSTMQSEVWAELEALLTKPYQHESGGTLRVRACCIDSGYQTEAVYAFVRPRQARGVYASKGLDKRAKAPLSRASRANRDGVKVFTIGTYSMKDVLFGRLKKRQPGPGYLHFCAQDPARCNGADAEYYAQFGAEKLVVRKVGGRLVREYRAVRERNEAIDLEVLALSALHTLGAAVRSQLERWVRKVQATGKAAQQAAQIETPQPAAARADARRPRRATRGPRRGGGGWVTGWK